MKKKIILFMSLVAGFSVSAQNQKYISNEFRAPLGAAIPQINVEPNNEVPGSGYIETPGAKGKSSSAVIWSEDFNGGLGDWTVGGTNSNLVMHDYDGPDSLIQFGWGPIPSPTAANGFVTWDFYARTPGWDFAANPAVGTLTSPVINLGTDTSTYISFYQQLYWCCEIDWEATLEVSTDGGVTFPNSIQLNKDFDRNERHWEMGLGYYFVFRLTDLVKDDPTNVVLRFNWTGDQADANDQYTNSYFWMLDDIQIHQVENNHLRFVELSVPIPNNPDNTAPMHDIIYNTPGSGKQGIMQIDQTVPISFDSNVENFGSKTQTGVKLVVDILDDNGPVTSLESPSADLDPDDTLSYETLNTPSWTPTSTGNYRIVYRAVSDSSSQPGAIMPSDTFMIYVTEALHSLDFNRFSNSFGTDNLGDGSTVANMMYFPTECELRSIDLRFSTVSVGGGDITIAVYDTAGFSQANGFGSTALYSRDFTVTQAMIDGGAPVTFDMTEDGQMFDITPGAYFFAITMYSNGGSNPIQMANDQTFRQEGATWMHATEGTSQGWWTGYANSLTFNAPWIRARLSPGIGLSENDMVNFAVYPNPSNGHNVKLEIREEGVYKVEVVSMTGKAAYNTQITVDAGGNQASSLNLSHLPKGVYVLNVSGKKGSKATKITIQ